MAKLIGRIKEQNELRKYYESKKSELVMLYGRRRIGKTFLVKEFFKDVFDFAITAIPKTKEVTTYDQLMNFHITMKRFGADSFNRPKSWIEAFYQLREMLEKSNNKGKKVVFFDELPWMDTPRSRFLPAFEHFWNDWASSRGDILLIICGSSASWMVNNILDNPGGLHNRLSGSIKLSAFSLIECEEFFKANGFNLTRKQIAEAYMTFGGVPYYISLMERDLSVAQNIDSLIFDKAGKLHNEYDHLYRSLFANSESYYKVVNALAQKDMGLTKEGIVKATGIKDGGTLTKIMKDLIQSDFVTQQNLLDSKTNYKASYRLTDFFSLFYNKIVVKNDFGDEHFWMHNINTPKYNTWKGLAFEELCMNHVAQIKQKLGISGVLTNVYQWSSKTTKPGAQIDLVIERKDDTINLCEIKYTKDKFAITSKYEKELEHKIEAFTTATDKDKSIQLTMITTNGITHNAHSAIVTNEILLDDLFVTAY